MQISEQVTLVMVVRRRKMMMVMRKRRSRIMIMEKIARFRN